MSTKDQIVHDTSTSTQVASHLGTVGSFQHRSAIAARGWTPAVALGLNSTQQSRLHVVIKGFRRAPPLAAQPLNPPILP